MSVWIIYRFRRHSFMHMQECLCLIRRVFLRWFEVYKMMCAQQKAVGIYEKGLAKHEMARFQ